MEKLLKELDEIYEECKEDNWDCEDGRGISIVSLNYAREFTYSLGKMRKPKALPFSTGMMGLSWHFNRNDFIITLLFSADGHISYSMIAPNIDDYGNISYSRHNIIFLIKKIKDILKIMEK